MRYEFMFPRELAAAKAARTPLLLPLGTIEYHGPHCAYGCDGLIARGLAEQLEARMEAVILPTQWYGCASYAVGGPEKGTIDVRFDSLKASLYDVLWALLEGGFRNVVLLIHHQFEREAYMPMTLAAASAAKTATMAFLERERGRGWWGQGESANYYNALDGADNPFNWLRVLPTMSAAAQRETGYDHAGQYECALLQALYPEAVDLDRLAESNEWFTAGAEKATPALGAAMLALSLQDLMARVCTVE